MCIPLPVSRRTGGFPFAAARADYSRSRCAPAPARRLPGHSRDNRAFARRIRRTHVIRESPADWPPSTACACAFAVVPGARRRSAGCRGIRKSRASSATSRRRASRATSARSRDSARGIRCRSPTIPKRGIGAARRWIKETLDRCAAESGARLKVEFDEFVQAADAARAEAVDARQRRGHARRRRPGREGAHARRVRPLRLDVRQRDERAVRRARRERRRVGHRRRDGARLHDGEDAAFRRRSSSWPSPARSRDCSAPRTGRSRRASATRASRR